MNKEEARALMDKVKANIQQRDNCLGHRFERSSDRLFRYTCAVCGSDVSSEFAHAYRQGLQHGKEGHTDGDDTK